MSHNGCSQGDNDQSLEVLPSTCETLGHVRYSYHHRTVLLDRSTDGSGSWSTRMGQTRGPTCPGMLEDSGQCCVFQRALQEHLSDHEGKVLRFHI